MKRKSDYVVERAVHGDNFKNEVVILIVGQYNTSVNEAEIAFESCMAYGYAVIKPISKEYPNGIMIATDIYRQTVTIG